MLAHSTGLDVVVAAEIRMREYQRYSRLASDSAIGLRRRIHIDVTPRDAYERRTRLFRVLESPEFRS